MGWVRNGARRWWAQRRGASRIRALLYLAIAALVLSGLLSAAWERWTAQ